MKWSIIRTWLKLSLVFALLLQSLVFVSGIESAQAAPPTSWTSQTAQTTSGIWSGVAYGNGTFVAVSSTGSIMTSSNNGVTWVSRTGPAGYTTAAWKGIAFGNGRFVAIKGERNSSNNAMYSTDNGATWTISTTPASDGSSKSVSSFPTNFQSITFSTTGGVNQFLAVSVLGINGNNSVHVIASPDGVTWSTSDLGFDTTWGAIGCSSAYCVVLNGQNNGTNASWLNTSYSTNGSTWTNVGSIPAGPFTSIAYGNGKYVALGSRNWNSVIGTSGFAGNVIYNSDAPQTAANWIKATSSQVPQNFWTAVVFANGDFVAVSNDGKVMTSQNGIDWTLGTAALAAAWQSITYGDGTFVAVGGSNGVMTSSVDAAPSAPVIGTVTRESNTSVSVPYTAGSSNGSAINGYTVTSSPSVTLTLTSSATANPLTFTGAFVQGQSYTFSMTATNTNGISPSSAASTSVTPFPGLPAPPTLGTVTRTNSTTVSIPFTAGSNSGSEITSYTITSSPSLVLTYSGTTSPFAVTASFVQGQSYTFSMTATNGIGSSTSSTSSNSITPYAAAPTYISLNPISGTSSGGTSVTITGTNLSNATSVTIGGAAAIITNNTATQIIVTAPAGTIGAQNVVITTAGGTATGAGAFTYTGINWTKVYETTQPYRSGSAYVYTSGFGLGASDAAQQLINAGRTFNKVRYVMTAKRGGTPYYVDVYFDKWETRSNPSSVASTIDKLAIPTFGNAVQTNVSNCVIASDWPGVSNLSSPVTTGSGKTCRLELWFDNYSAGSQSGLSPAGPSNYDSNDTRAGGSNYGSFQVHNITSGEIQTILAWNRHYDTNPDLGFGNRLGGSSDTDWTFAQNTLGLTDWKLQVFIDNAAIAPSAPTIGTVTRTNSTTVSIPFTAGADNGSTITSYSITSSPSISLTYSGTSSPMTVTGNFVQGQAYTFTISATNGVGTGSPSSTSNSITPFAAAVPTAPTIGTVTATDVTTISIPYTAGSANGSAITGYTVTSSPSVTLTLTSSATANPLTYTGSFVQGQAYTFTISATNGVGTSSSSSDSNSVMPFNTYIITITQSANGSISPTSATVDYGSNQLFTFTPSTGYSVASITVDGTALSSAELATAITSGYTFTNVTAIHSITATYSSNTYTITFDANGASGGTTASVAYGTDALLSAPTLSRTDYTPAGWSESSTGSVIASWNVVGTKTLYAIWTPAFVVTFVSAGTSVTSLTYTGTSLAKPSDPSRTGYDFANWKDSSNNVISWPFTPTASITLTAQWTIKTYLITITQTSNGSISPTSATVNHGSDQIFTFTPATGYSVVSITVDGTELSSSALATAITSGYTFTSVTSNRSITATFTGNSNTVLFNTQGGSPVDSQSWSTGTSLNLPVASTREGYAFNGWFDSATGGTKVGSGLASKNGLDFDGINDRITIPHSTAFSFTNAVTIEAWINTTSSSEQYITTKGENSFYLSTNLTSGKAGFYLNGVNTPSNGSWLNSTVTVNDGKWHHIAGTYDGTTLKIYVDGVLSGSRALSSTILNGSSVVQIGSRNTGGYFSGKIYDVRYWNVARSAAEISGSMNSTLTGSETGLVSAFTLNQGTAGGSNSGVTTATNTKSGASAGTLSGFALTSSTSNWIDAGSNSYTPTNTSGFTLFAQWTPITYTVTYKAGTNGSGIDLTQSFTFGNTATLKDATASLTRTGYVIAGWSTSDGGSQTHALSAAYSSAADLLLYPVWSAISYTITFDANGATGGTTASVAYGTNALSSAPNLSRTDYSLAGWSESSMGALISTWNVVGTKTLYAIWTPAFVVTFVSAGTAVSPLTYTGTALDKPTDPSRTGYSFVGWKNPSDATITWSYTPTASITLTAAWTINTYIITITQSDNGSISPTSATINYGSDQLFTCTPATGYSVASITVDGSALTSSALATAITSGYTFTNVIATHTITATYALNIYTIAFDANGATGGTTASLAHGTNALTSAPTLSRTDYTLAGWSESPTGAVITSWNVVGTKSLYAIWSPAFVVTFVSAGTAVAPLTYTTTALAKPADPSRTGYEFTSWKDASNNPISWPFTPTASITLTAQWTINTFVITITQTSNGSISPTSATVEYGSNQVFTFTPSTGFFVASITVDSVALSSAALATAIASGYTFTNVTATHSITATFAAIVYRVTLESPRATVAQAIIDYTVGSEGIILPYRIKANYVFLGWYTQVKGGGTQVGIAGARYTPTASVTLYSHWIQEVFYGIDPAKLSLAGDIRASTTQTRTLLVEANSSSVSVRVPAGALPEGTIVEVYSLSTDEYSRNKVTVEGDFIVNLVVAWHTVDELVPIATTPVVMTVRNATIKKGADVYAILGQSVKKLATATVDGEVIVLISEDPIITVTNPAESITNPTPPTQPVAATGGGGGGGGPKLSAIYFQLVEPFDPTKIYTKPACVDIYSRTLIPQFMGTACSSNDGRINILVADSKISVRVYQLGNGSVYREYVGVVENDTITIDDTKYFPGTTRWVVNVSPTASITSPQGDIKDVEDAQTQADKIIAEAKKQALAILEAARNEIKTVTDSEATKILDAATTRAAKILDDANAQASKLLEEIKVAAAAAAAAAAATPKPTPIPTTPVVKPTPTPTTPTKVVPKVVTISCKKGNLVKTVKGTKPKCPAGYIQVKATTPKPTPAKSASKTITITCVKGALSRKVTGTKPVCPTGFVKKS